MVAAPLLVILLPILAYLWFLGHFGVNVVRTDEWTVVPLLGAFHAGQLSLAMLWSQHNENRMLIPNLIQVVLGNVSHLDTRVPMGLGAAFLIVGFGILVAFYRSMGRWAYWAMVPVAGLLFSWVQVWNSLFGFQMAWYLVLLCLAVAVTGVTHPSRLGFAAALLAALVASYSSLQGLFLWPCGLVLLVGWTNGGRRLAIWLGTGALATLVYFYQYNFSTGTAPSLSFVLVHPVVAVKYFLITLGTVLPGLRAGATAASPQGSLAPTALAGAVILGLALAALAAVIRRGGHDRYLRASAALIAFGLLFDLAVDVGRAFAGAGQPFVLWRYPTYNLLLLAGIWLVAVRLWQLLGPSRPPQLVLAAAGLVVLVALQAGLGYHFGGQEGGATASQSQSARDVLANFRSAPPALQSQYLFLEWPEVQSWAPILVRLHDNVFAGAAASTYQRIGIVPGGIRGRLLPLPIALRQSRPLGSTAARAWGVLSTVYDQSPSLRAAYPETEPSFIERLLRWATGPAQQQPGVALYLRPYRKPLGNLAAAISSAARG